MQYQKGFFVGFQFSIVLLNYCILIKKGGGIRSYEALATVANIVSRSRKGATSCLIHVMGIGKR